MDNTIIVVISDNGASGEGGPNGSVNEVKSFNGYIDSVEESLRVLRLTRRAFDLQPLSDRLGDGVQHALQVVQALRLARGRYRRHRDHLLAFGIAAHGELRDNYVNVADITPTVLELLGIAAPDGTEGVSFTAALADSKADTGKATQFYSMLGTRGIWHDGWFANTVHPASPAGWSHFDDDRWEPVQHRRRP